MTVCLKAGTHQADSQPLDNIVPFLSVVQLSFFGVFLTVGSSQTLSEFWPDSAC